MNLRSKLLDRYKTNKTERVFLFFIGVLFYILNRLSEFSWDDYYYMFICKNEHFFGIYDREFVYSIQDVIKSQINHWTHINGRFVIHVIVQLFICILGLPLFQVCNSIMFVLLVRNLCRLCIEDIHRDSVQYYIVLFAIMWVLLGFMCIGLGYITSVAFAVNYLWSSAMFISFIYYYYKYKDFNENVSLLTQILLFLFALLTGAMNESFSVGLSASLFVYYLFCGNIKKLRGPIAYLTIGLWIGTILCCVNPANIARFLGSNESNVVRELSLRVFWLGSNVRLLMPMLVAIFVSIIAYIKDRHLVKWLKKQYVEIIMAIIFTFFFLILVGLRGNYQMFIGISLLCVILVYKLLELLYLSKKIKIQYKKYSCIFLMLGLFVHYIAIVVFSIQQNKDYNTNIQEYISSNGVIEYTPPKAPSLVKAYGIYLPDSRKQFIYSGLEFVYGYKPKFIPNKDVLAMLNNGELYDADWCYVIGTPENIKYDVKVTDFTHKNWMLKLWSKFSKSASTSFSLETYEVELNKRKYTIALKKNDDFIINKIDLIQKGFN